MLLFAGIHFSSFCSVFQCRFLCTYHMNVLISRDIVLCSIEIGCFPSQLAPVWPGTLCQGERPPATLTSSRRCGPILQHLPEFRAGSNIVLPKHVC